MGHRGKGRFGNNSAKKTVTVPTLVDGDDAPATTYTYRADDMVVAPEGGDLASRNVLTAHHPDHLAWYPAESDVSIRPGWFRHASQDSQVKTPAKLLDLYRTSVGRNSVLLLNVPPNRDGRISDPDTAAPASFGQTVRATYGTNLPGSPPAAPR
ncbi:alpha-L-fucosidase [Streptomyces sp. NBC_00378]|uniref:alpha-L-fucosidase n=1 Tax=unclassified Streptomyces TaxID=2593676 RepID=UPI002253DC99|nr:MULTISPECIES: alpha-L-fucosidase [unclassified Streptomyces]MCX5112737.1 alpha-L-fucosidase [Streptomyces sp. NBC_00378]